MKTFIKKAVNLFFRWPLYIWFSKRGVIPGRWDRLAEDFIYDFFHYKKTTLKQKLWAYKRGFISERIFRYGINEENYTTYFSDVDFYNKTSYKNQRLFYLFDDKLVTWYALQPFKEHLPEHYYAIENKKIRELNKIESNANNSVDGILKLLQEKKELAFKQTKGGHGAGFMKISFDGGQYRVNNKTVSKTELEKLINEMNGYIVTEYVYAHAELSQIYAATPEAAKAVSPSVIRIYTVYDDKEGSQIIGSYIRIGAAKAGLLVDYDGVIYCGIDYNNGTLFNPLIDVGDFSTEPCSVHPDTGKKIEGKIPNWEYFIHEIIKISNYLSITPYLTFDVVLTDNGLKVLEINSHGINRNLQPFYPVFDNKYARRLFRGEKS